MNQCCTQAFGADQSAALQSALSCLLSILETRDINYALLHPGTESQPDVSSDIDIILDKHPDKTIVPALQELDEELDTLWTQAFHYDVPNGYYYVVQVPCENGFAYLQLDCLHDPYGINRYHLSSQYLLQDKIKDGGFFRVSPIAETLYLLIKRALKKNATSNNVTDLANAVITYSSSLLPQMHNWLGKPLTEKITCLCENKQYGELAALLNNSGSDVERHFRRYHPVRYVLKIITTMGRQLKRFIRPTGLFIVLIGPDGCGKTTISSSLRTNMQRCFRGVWRFHWRPKLLPKLGGSSNQAGNEQTGSNTPPTPPNKAKYNQLVSMVRFSYYLADFVLGYWLVIYPKKARSTFIVGERYFADILVHPVRYGFNLPDWFMRACAIFVPKPDAIVLLSGDAQKIHDRKPELEVSTISKQLQQYSKEIVNWGEHFTADTNQSVDDVVRQIERFFGELLHRRVNHQGVNTLLAYPRIGRSRLLLDPNISRQNLSRIYNPSSITGKLSLLPLKVFPWPLNLLAAKRNKTIYYSTFPRAVADKIIMQHFAAHDNIHVSYYMGNGGPRTKVTAQVTSHGNIIAYVKIAGTNIARELLENEYQSLLAVHNLLRNTAPSVITRKTYGGWDYLFTTAPDQSYKNSYHKLTAKHIDLVENIFSSTRTTLSHDDYLAKTSLSARVNSIYDNADLNKTRLACNTALDLLADCFANTPILIGRKHGDFCPWNILTKKASGKLYIFDWEYSDPVSGALSDFIHFIRSLSHHVLNHSPERTAEHLLCNPELRKLAERLHVQPQQIPGYIIIYLLHEILRHTETYNTSTPNPSLLPDQVRQAAYLGACLHSVNTATKHGNIPRRVCVAAYACEPEKGSEPGVGWNWVNLIAKNNHAWVFTKHNNKEPIEHFLKEHPELNLNFVYIDVPKWLTFWKKGQRGVRTYYYLWQFFALYRCRKLHKSVDFHLAHHVSFVNDWLWSFAAFAPVPFIWGPIGSHPNIPRQLLPHGKALISEMTRLTIQRGMRLLDPLYWLTVIRAKKIIVINKEIGKQFPMTFLAKDKIVIEGAIAHSQAVNPEYCEKSGYFDVLYVGRFHHTKCPHLAIEAFQRAQSAMPDSRLILVGRGPEEKHLKQLAKAHSPASNIVFHSWCTQAEVLELMARSSLFLFPSTEGGGMVVIEAMSLGLPVVCLNYGGPGSMVTDNTGSRVDVSDKDSVVTHLGNALTDYYNHHDKLAKHSANAIEHTEKSLSWESKSERINIIYNDLHESCKIPTCK